MTSRLPESIDEYERVFIGLGPAGAASEREKLPCEQWDDLRWCFFSFAAVRAPGIAILPTGKRIRKFKKETMIHAGRSNICRSTAIRAPVSTTPSIPIILPCRPTIQRPTVSWCGPMASAATVIGTKTATLPGSKIRPGAIRSISIRRALLLKQDDVVKLGFVQSRDYQTQLETLYLSALSLTLNRFDFAPPLVPHQRHDLPAIRQHGNRHQQPDDQLVRRLHAQPGLGRSTHG